MRILNTSKCVVIPRGVTCEIAGNVVTITGTRGTLKRDFSKHNIRLRIEQEGESTQVVCELWFARKKRSSVVAAVASHIRNMVVGVQKGYRYTMKSVFAHFPINMTVGREKRTLELRKFLGEKNTRVIPMEDGVTVDASTKDELVIEGNDLDAVARSATAIHVATKVRNKDIRKFLDGVYVSEKGTVLE